MDIELLIEILGQTSVKSDDIAEYVGAYLDASVAIMMASVMEGLEENGEEGSLNKIIDKLREFEESKKGLNIADDSKTQEIYDGLGVVMKDIAELEKFPVIAQKMVEEVKELDSKMTYEIMKSCNENDRKAIMKYIKNLKAVLADKEVDFKNPKLNTKADDRVFNDDIFTKDTIKLIENFGE